MQVADVVSKRPRGIEVEDALRKDDVVVTTCERTGPTRGQLAARQLAAK